MTEIIQKIPAELENSAKGGFVTRATMIIDRAKNKNQGTINEEVDLSFENHQQQLNNKYNKDEVYNKEETYNRTELNNMITTPSQGYVSVSADDTWLLADIDTLISTAAGDDAEKSDTIYRVGNWDGAQYNTGVYTEYAWNGSSYVNLSKKQPGIDDTPTLGSNNLTTSGAVNKIVAAINVNFVNGVYNTPYGDANGARSAVPTEYRRNGLIITYLLSDGWHTEQFNGTPDINWHNNHLRWTALDSEYEKARNQIIAEFEGSAILESYSFKKGGYISTNTTSQINISKDQPNNEYQCMVIPCTAGDVFTIRALGGNTPRTWAFLDSDRYKLTISGTSLVNWEIITAPTNAAYLVVNDKYTQNAAVVKGTTWWHNLQLPISKIKQSEIDSVPTENSNNLLRSGNIPKALIAGYNDIELIDYVADKYISSASGDVASSSQFKIFYIPVESGQTYRIRGNYSAQTGRIYGIYTVEPSESMSSADCIGTGDVVSANVEVLVTIPSSESNLWLAISKQNSYNLSLSQLIYKRTIQDEFESVSKQLSSLEEETGRIENLNNFSFIDFEDKKFGFQKRCIHHDNFYREVPNAEKPWQIGNNYFINPDRMSYISPRSDYNEADDGFRLNTVTEPTGDEEYPTKVISGYLTNNTEVAINSAFRILRISRNRTSMSLIEVSVPSSGKYSELVFNFKSQNNYESFLLYNDEGFISVSYVSVIEGEKSVSELFTNRNFGDVFKVLCIGNKFKMYQNGWNNYYILTAAAQTIINSIIIDKNLPIALHITNDKVYEYRTISLYDIIGKYNLDINRAIAENKVNYPGIYFAGKIVEDAYLSYAHQIKDCVKIAGVFSTVPTLDVNVPSSEQVGITAGQYIIVTSTNGIYRLNGHSWSRVNDLVENNIYIDTNNKIVYIYVNSGTEEEPNYELVQQGNYEPTKSFPEKAQRFELRRKDGVSGDATTCRTEWLEADCLVSNLRKRHFSFDVFLPSDFILNDNKGGEGEAILQLPTSTEGGKDSGPTFSISIEHMGGNFGARWQMNRRNVPTKQAPRGVAWDAERYGDESVDLGLCEYGKWIHWDIYMQEGYMPEHSPYIIVKKDDNVVYESYLPNCYNTMNGSNFHYGIYKRPYLRNLNPNAQDYVAPDEQDLNRKVILYIANFNLES